MTELVNTLEQPSEFDALVKLRPGEPYFLLIGRDRLAPPLVCEWVKRNRQRAHDDHGAGRISDEKLDQELRQSTQAETIAWSMQAYKAGHNASSASVVKAEPAYTGHLLPADTLARDRRQAALTKAGSRISNAVAELTESAAVAREHGMVQEALDLESAALFAKTIEPHITPQRPFPASSNA